MKESVYIIQTPPVWLKTPPLSLVYLNNHLNKNNILNKAIDLNLAIFQLCSISPSDWLTLNKDIEEGIFGAIEKVFSPFLEYLYSQIKDVPFVGISLFKRNLPFSFSLADKIRQRYPQKAIIFGGPHTLFLQRQGLLNEKDFWVVGEGENSLLEIIQGSSQKIHQFKESSDLDSLPFLDFSEFNFKSYANAIPILSSRGCPHKCNFCSEKLLYKKFRHHSAKYMVDLIKKLKSRYQMNTFLFCDSLINYDLKWLNEFCSLVIKEKLDIKWEAQIRAQKNFPLELAQLMKKSGCYNLFVGLESACDKTLKSMNKGIDRQTSDEFVRILNQAQLHFEISLILGFPGETEQDFLETLTFIVSNKDIIPKIAQVNPFVDYLDNYPGQEFPDPQAKKRVEKLIKVLQEEKIKYTKGFINNLVY
jgi:anaerobic magnesium-protoporphyrin IX monomethyl ester cyclase